MAKLFDGVTLELKDFIHQQRLFFAATASLSLTGHINLSPKGLDSFQILSPTRTAYLDLTGSGLLIPFGRSISPHVRKEARWQV